ncbi:MAG: hypothetical protein AB1721_03105 [Patescibacteria group bacterium]
MRKELVFFFILGLVFLGLEVFSLSRFLSFSGLFFSWVGFGICFWRLNEKELIFPWVLFSLIFSVFSRANLVFSLFLFGFGFWLLALFHKKLAKLTSLAQSFGGGTLFLIASLLILVLGQKFKLISFWAFGPWFFSALGFLLGLNLLAFAFRKK